MSLELNDSELQFLTRFIGSHTLADMSKEIEGLYSKLCKIARARGFEPDFWGDLPLCVEVTPHNVLVNLPKHWKQD